MSPNTPNPGRNDASDPAAFADRIAVPPDLLSTIYEILDATILLLGADFGNIQLYDPRRKVLEIVAHRGGYSEEFLRILRTVSVNEPTASGRSLRDGQRVIIPDVTEDEGYSRYIGSAVRDLYRSVQATPLYTRQDEFVGVLATQTREPHAFTMHELQVLDLYARQAADAIVRSRVEADLKVARRRLESALGAGELGVFDWDIASDRVYGDVNFQRMFGVPFDDHGSAAREVFEPLIHPDDREQRRRQVQRALESGESYESEYRILSGNRVRWVISRGKVERDADGQPGHFVGVLLDITDRRRAEQERREIQNDMSRLSRTYETLLSGIEDFAYAFDRAGRFLYANPPLLKLYQRSLDQVVGKTFNELGYDQGSHDRHIREILQVISTRQPFRGEIELTFADGASTTYDYIFSPVLNNSGEVDLVVGITRDVTERKRYEETLQEADRQKNAFLAQLAHELRNPLAPIRNAARIFRQKQAREPDAIWASDLIDRQVDHLTRLIDDLLDVSRISRNKLELRRQRIQLQDIVRGAVEISRPTIDQHGHDLMLRIEPEPISLLADPARLTQAVMNLIINAAKYTDAGGHIELTAKREGDAAVLRVSDNGIGIAQDMLPRVFDMFFQADPSHERSQGGLGIGLSLVKSVVELHGGTVTVHSDGPGKGSEFALRVPAISAAPAAQPRPAAETTAKPPQGRRVLVVDDNRDAADSLAIFLQLGGHETRTAYDGEEAVAAAASFDPQVVLLDIGMPKLNGYEACRRIRETAPGKDMLIVAQTGWGQEEDKRRTREAGFDDHLVKPVDPAKVLKLVAEVKGP